VLRRNACSSNSDDHDARMSLILCCHAMMLQLVALRSMGLNAIGGMAVVPSVVMMNVPDDGVSSSMILGGKLGLAMPAPRQELV